MKNVILLELRFSSLQNFSLQLPTTFPSINGLSGYRASKMKYLLIKYLFWKPNTEEWWLVFKKLQILEFTEWKKYLQVRNKYGGIWRSCYSKHPIVRGCGCRHGNCSWSPHWGSRWAIHQRKCAEGANREGCRSEMQVAIDRIGISPKQDPFALKLDWKGHKHISLRIYGREFHGKFYTEFRIWNFLKTSHHFSVFGFQKRYFIFDARYPESPFIDGKVVGSCVLFIRVHAMSYLFIYLRILLLICIDHIYLHHSLVFTCAWYNLIITGYKYAVCTQFDHNSPCFDDVI